jgi:probable F420-dependent oxidoreductase
VKFSYFVPNILEGRFNTIGSVTPASMLERCRAAEDLGYDGVWLGEFIETQKDVASGFPDEPPNNYAPIVLKTAIAMATQRLRITSGVVVLPYHDPFILGREMATLDQFSGGRITLGIGLGGPIEEYKRTKQRVGSINRFEMMGEQMAAMRLLWTERKASFDGKYYGFKDVETYPKPVQNPFPVYIAGRTENVYQRVGQIAQGWIEVTIDAQKMKEGIEAIRQSQAEAGRAGERIEFARQFFMSLGKTDDEAQETRAAAIQYRNQVVYRRGMSATEQPGSERYFIGGVDYMRRRLHAYAEVGVTEMCVTFFEKDTAAALRQLELFATKVMPEFQ